MSEARPLLDGSYAGETADEMVALYTWRSTEFIASDIPGSVGMLGDDYPGYYPVGDCDGLSDLPSGLCEMIC